MATPTFDARQGLSPDVLQDLRQAHRVAHALKDRHTAVLGYWIKVHSPGGQDMDELRAVLPPATVYAPANLDLSAKCPVIIDMSRGTAEWGKAIKPLRTGDVITLDWKEGPPERDVLAVDFRPVHLGRTWEVRLRRERATLMNLLLHPSRRLGPKQR